MTADAHQRQQALKLDQSWIIQAPAGSGKTELLTQRFLKLLGHVDRPERILAITFTRKATQEMRGRIMQRLQQAASGELPDKEHEKLAVELARIALKQDQEQDWKLLRNPGRLRIHTIDGLCSQLLSRDPETGSHSADLQILEDAKPLYRLAAQRVFEEFGAVPGHRADFGESGHALVRLLVHLDGNSQALTDLLVKMMGVRDQWIRRVGADVATIQAVLEDRQNRELDHFRGALSEHSLENAGRVIADLGRTMFDQDQPAAQFATAFDHEDGTIQNHVMQAYWLSQVLTTGANIPRAVGGISRRLFPGLPDDLRELPGALKTIYSDWASDPSALAAIGRMARMPPLDMVAPQEELLEDIRMVLRAAMIQLYAVFAENGQTDFQYIADTALQVLGKEDQPGQVLLAEDMRLEHILMDEFQDTSHTQFELLRRLTAGWQCDDGRSLFLVGDPMQSIYRFREADVGQFIDIMQGAGLGQLMPRAIHLESNFRSDSEIVDWVNEHFGRVFPSRHESDAGAVSYTRFEAEQGSGGIVGIHSLSDDKNDIDEAQIAVELIRDARNSNDDPSIGVLGRTRKHLEVIAQELVRLGIDFEAVQIDKLVSRPVVRDLMAITRALYHPADRVAWLSILRAPWCGLNVKQLHAVAGEDPDRSMLDMIALALEENILAGEVHERLARAHTILVNAVALRASRPLRERVEFTWLNLGGPYCYASSAELDNAEAFLSRLDEIERESGEAPIERLEDALENLYAGSRPSNLQLMTIHKAKGLEFDVVILPGLDRSSGSSDKPLLALQTFKLSNGDDAVLMAPVTQRGQNGPGIYGYLMATDSERSSYESQRTLYVAATRAKHQLHLIARIKRTKSGDISARKDSFLKMLLPAFEAVTEPENEDVSDIQKENPQPSALPLLRLANEPTLEIESIDTALRPQAALRELPSLEATALGEALHYWLELIHDNWERGWTPDWFQQHPEVLESTLRRAGAPENAMPGLLNRLTAMIVQVLISEGGRAIVSPGNKSESWTELPIHCRTGNRIIKYIVDRLYRDSNGSLVIVDYKSGEDSDASKEKWQEQLNRYRQLVNALQSGAVSNTLVQQISEHEIINFNIELNRDSIDYREG